MWYFSSAAHFLFLRCGCLFWRTSLFIISWFKSGVLDTFCWFSRPKNTQNCIYAASCQSRHLSTKTFSPLVWRAVLTKSLSWIGDWISAFLFIILSFFSIKFVGTGILFYYKKSIYTPKLRPRCIGQLSKKNVLSKFCALCKFRANTECLRSLGASLRICDWYFKQRVFLIVGLSEKIYSIAKFLEVF